MKAITRIARGCLAVAATLLFWGCAGSGSDQATQLSPTGQHAAGFVDTHWIDYAKSPDQCATCHGSTTDPNSTGGTSGISCYSCHGGGVAHPAGWEAGLSHGRLGAQAAATASTGTGFLCPLPWHRLPWGHRRLLLLQLPRDGSPCGPALDQRHTRLESQPHGHEREQCRGLLRLPRRHRAAGAAGRPWLLQQHHVPRRTLNAGRPAIDMTRIAHPIASQITQDPTLNKEHSV